MFHDMMRRIFKLTSTFVISDFVPSLHFITKLQGYPSLLAEDQDFVKGLSHKILGVKGYAQEKRDDPNYVSTLKDIFLQTPFDGGVPMTPEKAEQVLLVCHFLSAR